MEEKTQETTEIVRARDLGIEIGRGIGCGVGVRDETKSASGTGTREKGIVMVPKIGNL